MNEVNKLATAIYYNTFILTKTAPAQIRFDRNTDKITSKVKQKTTIKKHFHCNRKNRIWMQRSNKTQGLLISWVAWNWEQINHYQPREIQHFRIVIIFETHLCEPDNRIKWLGFFFVFFCVCVERFARKHAAKMVLFIFHVNTGTMMTFEMEMALQT